MTPQLCNFNQSKALKALGFSWECDKATWLLSTDNPIAMDAIKINWNGSEKQYYDVAVRRALEYCH